MYTVHKTVFDWYDQLAYSKSVRLFTSFAIPTKTRVCWFEQASNNLQTYSLHSLHNYAIRK